MTDWSMTDAYGEQKGDILSLELGSELYEHLLNDPGFTASIRRLRQEAFRELGVYLPSVRIRTGDAAEPHRYVIRVRGERAADGHLHPPLLFAEEETDPKAAPDLHPVRRTEGTWTLDQGEESREILLAHLAQVLNRRLPDLLTYEGVALWLKQAEPHSPRLIKELTAQGMTTGLLWSVMKRLLKDRIPLAPFEDLLETMLEFYLENPHDGYTPPEWTHPYPGDIAKYVAEKKKDRRAPIRGRSGNVIGFSR